MSEKGFENVQIIDKNFVKQAFLPKNPLSHKGNFGHAVIIGGCKNYIGAPCFSCESANEIALSLSNAGLSSMLSGCGTSEIALPDFLCDALYKNVRFSAVYPLESKDGYIVFNLLEIDELLKRASSFAIGMGAGDGETDKIVKHVLKNGKQNFVIDADALVKCNDMSFSNRAILTPHIGEMSKIIGKSKEYVLENQTEICRDFAKTHKCVVVLKSTQSVVSDGESVYLNVTGNQKLAKGGSGDVLSGIIAGLLARGIEPLESACAASYILGKCAEESRVNEFCHLPTDIIAVMNKVVDKIVNE